MNFKKTAALMLLVLATTLAAAQAHAANIQMLPPIQNPPVDSTKPTDPCTGSDGNKVLTWDGTEAIKCNKDLKFDTTNAKLDVAGGIKVGSDTAGCNASKGGTIRYNSSTKILEYCNESSWSAVGGGLPQCQTFYANTNGQSNGGTFHIYNHEMIKFNCPATYPRFLSGSCWRISSGVYIGNQNDPDGNNASYLCRIEGGAGVTVHVTCCK